MKLMIYLTITCCVLTTSAWSQTRYFLFPSEVRAYSQQFSQTVNVFGIVHSVKNLEADTFGFQFSLSDKNESITVVYEGGLPDLFEPGIPAVVHGEFEENIFSATSIIVKFSTEYLPVPALNELRSYGVMIPNE